MKLTASNDALQVVDCYFPKDRALNRRKNFCFVTFATQQVSLSKPLLVVAPARVHGILSGSPHCCPVTGLGLLQAAEKAAAQSNREISGYRIESISLTHERQEHYLRKHVGLAGPSGPLAGLQPGGSAGIADSFPGYPSAEQLGSISGFPSQLVSLLPSLLYSALCSLMAHCHLLQSCKQSK